MNKLISLVVAIVCALPVSSASAAGPATTGTQRVTAENVISAALSPRQRGAAIGQFVRKWGPYVERTYAVDVHTWSQRMVGQFALGDSANIQRALKRDTFEGAMAELDGVGHRLSDERVITKLASIPTSNPAPMALGDINKDLVYTPVVPCRLADTRLAGGKVLAGTTRTFAAWGNPNYTAWGGSSTDCGLLAQHMTTAVINITAVFPSIGGFATAFAGDIPDASRPLASSVNFIAGAVVNNSVLVNINPSGSPPDWKLYSGADAHYVADIVGFYDNPLATPLDCVTTPANEIDIAGNGGQGTVFAPNCPAGFTSTATYCHSFFIGVTVSGSEDTGSCHAQNNLQHSSLIYARNRCCRVPGR